MAERVQVKSEVRRVSSTEVSFLLEPDELAAYNALADEDKADWVERIAIEQAEIVSDWDSGFDATAFTYEDDEIGR